MLLVNQYDVHANGIDSKRTNLDFRESNELNAVKSNVVLHEIQIKIDGV